jgi:hypothetical protein
MYDINITVDNHGVSPGMTCQVALYSSQVPASGSNVVDLLGPTLTYTTWPYYDFGGFSSTGWWKASSWLYAQLECDLAPGQELVSYQTEESGSYTNDRIYPASANCSTMSGYPQGNWYAAQPFLPNTFPAGFVEAPGGQQFFYSCILPADWTQFSMGPCNNTSRTWDWSFSSSGPWTTQVGSNQASAWPSYNFPSTTLPASGHTNTAGTFLNTGASYNIYFQLNESMGTYDGDMSILSYRDTYTEP